jgi:uncharacterized protein (DUF1501 family)
MELRAVPNVNRLLTRRSFLKQGASLVAAGWAVPSFIAETARQLDWGGLEPRVAHAAGPKVLILIQLAGGNDGVNTVIPYANPAYAAARPGLAISPSQVLQIDGAVGLHPSLTRLRARYTQQQVAIVQGVSYPNPNRSHFRGTDIWESAVPDRLEAKGWVGRYLESCACQRPDYLEAMTVGSSQGAGAFWTEMALVPAVASISSFRYTSANSGNTTLRNAEIAALRSALNQAEGTAEGEFLRQSMNLALDDADILASAASSYTPVGTYPNNTFGNSMKLIAQLIAANVGTSIFYVSLGGFDTHSDQLTAHANLFTTLDQSIDALMIDLERVGRLDDVAMMTFSEFGRRLAQNGSSGTDHGVAAPMFVIGGGVSGGLYGEYPSLTDLSSGDLKMKVDFRQVYATVLDDWLGMSPTNVLGGSYAQLPLFAPTASCAPRPPVQVRVNKTGDGRLAASLTAGGGVLREIRFGPMQNATVEVAGGPSGGGSLTYRPSTSTNQATFHVRRVSPGAATVPLVVVDDCGEWKSFVGGGAGAF